VSAGRRPLLSTALVVLLGAASGGAAWLGVAESPKRPAPSPWQGFVSSTVSTGSLAFESVTTTTGAADSIERARGVVDFSRRDASEVSVVLGRDSPAQWNEIEVVSGSAYERAGTDRPGRPLFSSVWTPLASFVVPPFPPLTGRGQEAPPVGGPSLRRVSASVVGGVAATEYQLAPVGLTCVRGDGDQRSENVSSTVWVDGNGRIVRFENLTAVAVAGVQSAILTVTTFTRFGAPIAPGPPVRAAEAPAGPGPETDPLAGCLLTPG
jgi:hypothetical protein